MEVKRAKFIISLNSMYNVFISCYRSPKVQDDNTSTDSSTPKSAPDKSQASASPEVAPSYTKYLKNIIDKKFKNDSGVWNKENGDTTPKVISNDVSKTIYCNCLLL